MRDWSSLFPLAWPAAWSSPALLKLLDGSAINGLVVEKLSVLGAEILAACASRNIEVIERAGIHTAPLAKLASDADLVVVSGSLWPGVRGFADGGSAAAGPTGSPWVDSNGWLIQLARAKLRARTVWLAHEPPKGRAVRTADYQLAVADAMTWGARWIISFDPSLQNDLERGNASALRTWRDLNETAGWFLSNASRQELHPVVRLAIVSHFDSPVVNEAVNLLARRFVNVRAILPQELTAEKLEGIRAVYLAEGAITGPLREFARRGGMVITNVGEGPSSETSLPSPTPRFAVMNANGRWAVAQARIADPYLLATDLHLLLTRAEDQVRLWNSATVAAEYRETAECDRARIDLVNYAASPGGNEMSLQTLAPFTRARFVVPGKQAVDLEVRRGFAGAEIALPAFAVAGYLEFWDRSKDAPRRVS